MYGAKVDEQRSGPRHSDLRAAMMTARSLITVAIQESQWAGTGGGGGEREGRANVLARGELGPLGQVTTT